MCELHSYSIQGRTQELIDGVFPSLPFLFPPVHDQKRIWLTLELSESHCNKHVLLRGVQKLDYIPQLRGVLTPHRPLPTPLAQLWG